MYDERTLEQMDLLLADLHIESGVRILKHDILLRLQQSLSVKGFRGAGLGQCVDIGPFASTGPTGGGVPLLAEGGGETWVAEER